MHLIKAFHIQQQQLFFIVYHVLLTHECEVTFSTLALRYSTTCERWTVMHHLALQQQARNFHRSFFCDARFAQTTNIKGLVFTHTTLCSMCMCLIGEGQLHESGWVDRVDGSIDTNKINNLQINMKVKCLCHVSFSR